MANSSNFRIGLSYGILLLVICAITSTPILGKPTSIIIIWFLMSYHIMKYSYNPNYFRNSNLIIYIFLYITLIYGYRFIYISDAPWGNYMNEIFFFSLIILALNIEEWKNNKYAKIIWWLMVIILAANIADNIRLSILYPSINTARIYLDETFLKSINAGGSRFYTFSFLVSIVFFFTYLNCYKKWTKNIMLCLTILGGIYIVGFCYKASVVVFFLLSLFLLYYAKIAVKTHIFIFTLITSVVLVFFIISVYQDEIIKFIIAYSPNERITIRFITMIDSNNIEANEATITGRTNLYMLSVQTWLTDTQTFLLGIGDHRATFGVRATGIGQHSELLDSLARYGLLGAFLLINIFKNAYQFVLTFFPPKYRLQLFTIFVIVIACGFTKALFYPSASFAIFILLPLSSMFLSNQNESIQYGSKL